MEYNQIIINRISELCKSKGITYNKLAYMSGLNQSTIDNIIRGVSKNPRIKTLHKIANGLSMTITEFLDIPELNNYYIDDESD